MYNAIQKSKLVSIDLQGMTNACWKIFDKCNLDHDEVVQVWNIMLKNYGVNLSDLMGWEKEDTIPYMPRFIISSFDYATIQDYEDELNKTIFTELLNNQYPESEWTTMFSNYFIWLGYQQDFSFRSDDLMKELSRF